MFSNGWSDHKIWFWGHSVYEIWFSGHPVYYYIISINPFKKYMWILRDHTAECIVQKHVKQYVYSYSIASFVVYVAIFGHCICYVMIG